MSGECDTGNWQSVISCPFPPEFAHPFQNPGAPFPNGCEKSVLTGAPAPPRPPIRLSRELMTHIRHMNPSAYYRLRRIIRLARCIYVGAFRSKLMQKFRIAYLENTPPNYVKNALILQTLTEGNPCWPPSAWFSKKSASVSVEGAADVAGAPPPSRLIDCPNRWRRRPRGAPVAETRSCFRVSKSGRYLRLPPI